MINRITFKNESVYNLEEGGYFALIIVLYLLVYSNLII